MLTLLSVFNYKSFLYVTMNNFGWVQNKYIKNYNDMWVCTGGGGGVQKRAPLKR